ncbi:MAG: (2Fe-2S) ferredoxin domain-containing protein [Thermomicrobiales bacterium]|nr:(2Fe-2S) ferredoxin domain-containing protein [Thermomicrobiales bacterium]
MNTCDSIELCDIGPNIVVYPDGIIYSHVTTADLPDIIRHLEGGEVVERLVLSPETPEEAARERFYREATADGPTMVRVDFEALMATHGYDEAWLTEQARRGFIARKEADGVPTITVTSKALQRYRIELSPPVD